MSYHAKKRPAHCLKIQPHIHHIQYSAEVPVYDEAYRELPETLHLDNKGVSMEKHSSPGGYTTQKHTSKSDRIILEEVV
jgi:hypothetical protein